jgi:AmmeMemoRadiSam system protein B
MERLRQPAVAGTFYPADPARLRTVVRAFLDAAAPRGGPPKAIIAPHAGYRYSGPVAGSAYARLGLGRDAIRRVVLLGPSHRIPFRGLGATSAAGFATPLGVVPVDRDGVEALLALPAVRIQDGAHGPEHSLEVQLPFLQEVLTEFSLVPVVVGEAGPGEVEAALERLWGGPETAVVVSSDLSHYLDQATARQMDQATAEAITALSPEGIGPDAACGSLPVRGLLLAARRRGLVCELLDLRNSGDTAGDPACVVGYGAFAFI